MQRGKNARAMIHLTSIEKRPSFPQEERFPYNVPVIAQLEQVRFETAVTFLVGENGSGKSTFLEALATSAGLPTVGAEERGAIRPWRRCGSCPDICA